MLNTVRIYKQLTPPLQQRLTQLALLQQRAALLARMPAMTLTKGKPVRWAATPAPLLLRQVQLLAANDDHPKLSALILRNWFQHKMELHHQVWRSLCNHNYPVPQPAVLPELAPSLLRVNAGDRGPGPQHLFYYPDGLPLPDSTATPEEVTLMAELLGWCVHRPSEAEVNDSTEPGRLLKAAYGSQRVFVDQLAKLRATVPAASPAGQLLAQGVVPLVLDAASQQALRWDTIYGMLLDVRDHLYSLAEMPTEGVPVTEAGFMEGLDKAEERVSGWLFQVNIQTWMLNALALVLRTRHRQQPDFAPLQEVHARARDLTTRVAGCDKEGGEKIDELMLETQPLLALLDFIHVPSRLQALDPQAPELLELHNGLPPAVVNALLLHKLTVADPETAQPE